MKKLPSVKAFGAIIAIVIISIFSANKIDGSDKVKNNTDILRGSTLASIGEKRLQEKIIINNNLLAINNDKREVKETIVVSKEEEKKAPAVVYNGMTMEQLTKKLDRNLKSTLKGYGNVFAKYAIKYNVDPYLSLAIVLHETGCNSGVCSTLASKCNNIGGMKGSPGCGGGPYKRFSSLEQGIKAFYQNLSKNYYKQGLTTPETIGKKYAESTTWPERIRYYINVIKKS